MLGTTVLYSSGDDGVASRGVCLNSNRKRINPLFPQCLTDNPFLLNQPSSHGKVFNPGFPVTCPFVTAVGATQINPRNPVTAPEGACEQVIFSGGGFSNITIEPTAGNNYWSYWEKYLFPS